MLRRDREPSIVLMVAAACVVAWCMGCATIQAAHMLAELMA